MSDPGLFGQNENKGNGGGSRGSVQTSLLIVRFMTLPFSTDRFSRIMHGHLHSPRAQTSFRLSSAPVPDVFHSTGRGAFTGGVVTKQN